MYFLFKQWRWVFIAGFIALQACAFMPLKLNQLAAQLTHQGVNSTLQTLEALKVPQRDRVPYLLNRGLLKYLSGDPAGSIEDLQEAKHIMAKLNATSLLENTGALTINETLRHYAGSPSDQVLLHVVLAMNYLSLQDLEGARVEILQSELKMRQLSKTNSNSGQLASAHFLGGVVYELNHEWDNAFISYRHAANLLDNHQQTLPEALQTSLLQVSQLTGRDEEYQHYVKRFGYQVQPLKAGDKDIIVLYSDGVVTAKQQHFISLYSPQLAQQVSLALPYYPKNHPPSHHLDLAVNGKHSHSQLLESIDTLVREDLGDALPLITATAMTRIVAKYQLTRKAQEEDNILGQLVNLANTFTEAADLRSWNMLPATLQVARLRIQVGQTLSIDGLPVDKNNPHGLSVLPFNQSQISLIFASSLTLPQ